MSENIDPNLALSSSRSHSSGLRRTLPTSRSQFLPTRKICGKEQRKKTASKSAKKKKPPLSVNGRKTPWTMDEDRELIRLLQEYRATNTNDNDTPSSGSSFEKWIWAASKMNKGHPRTAKACKSRWNRRSLSPDFHALFDRKVDGSDSRRRSYKENVESFSLPPLNQSSKLSQADNPALGTPATFAQKPFCMQWSPFVFHTEDIERIGERQAIAKLGDRDFQSAPDLDISGDDFHIDLAPLDFRLSPDVDFSKSETSALLSILCSDQDSDENHTDMSSAKRGKGRASAWGSRLMQREVMDTPQIHRQEYVQLIKGDHHISVNNVQNTFGTPPKDIEISPSSRYSAISTMTRTSMTRKKRRISSDMHRTPKNIVMPDFSEAKVLDVDFTNTQPKVSFEDVETEKCRSIAGESTGLKSPDDNYTTPQKESRQYGARNTTGATNRSALFRALSESKSFLLPPSSRRSKVSLSEPRHRNSSSFFSTPHPPNTTLKNFHSEPRRRGTSPAILSPSKTQPRPTRLLIGKKTPLMTLQSVNCRKDLDKSPIGNTLVGIDLNRVLCGYGSPDSESNRSEMDVLGVPNDF